MSDSETNSKDAIKEEQPITKKDIEQLSNTLSLAFKNIDERIKQLEQKPVMPTTEQPQTQQQSKLSPELLQFLIPLLTKQEDSSFGTSENKQFFAEVGKADFDSFRLLQQRRLIKLLEQANKSGVV